MAKLTIGKDGFALPQDLVTSTQAIIARKRRGKTYTASVEAEDMLEMGAQIAVVDPTGAWWGLRSSRDGKKAGYPVTIFGGEHQDAPLDFRTGGAMARALIEHGFSAIFDVSRFSTEEQWTFARDLFAELLRLNQQPIHLFIDEADTFAPQQTKSKVQFACLGATTRLIKQGGIKSLGVTLITQRSSSINWDALSQIDMLTVLQMGAPHDINPAVAWLAGETSPEFANEVRAGLPKLGIGEAFLGSAHFDIARRVQIRERRTFNSGRTLKFGEVRIKPKLAAIDAQKLGEEIAEAVKRTQEESPEFLKAKCADLERRLREKGEANVAGLSEHIAEMERELDELRPLREELPEVLSRISTLEQDLANAHRAKEDAINALEAFAAEIEGKVRELREERVSDARGILDRLPAPPPGPVLPAQSARLAAPAPSPEPAVPVPVGGFHPNGAQKRIFAALSQFRATRINNVPRLLVCLFAGYSNLTSKGFANAIGALRTADLVSYPKDGEIALTEKGLFFAPPTPPVRSDAELHQRILGMLDGPGKRVLRPLLDAFPQAVKREALLTASGYSNGTSKGFANSLGRLRTLGFVDYPEQGTVACTELCFLRGRR